MHKMLLRYTYLLKFYDIHILERLEGMNLVYYKKEKTIELDFDDMDRMQYPLGYQLTDFLSLNVDEIIGIIESGFPSTNPGSENQVRHNLDNIFGMVDRLETIHPYLRHIRIIFSHYDDLIDEYKKSVYLDDYNYTIPLTEDDNKDMQIEEFYYKDSIDRSPSGIMNHIKNTIISWFRDIHDYFSKGLDFIFRDGIDSEEPFTSLKRYYTYTKLISVLHEDIKAGFFHSVEMIQNGNKIKFDGNNKTEYLAELKNLDYREVLVSTSRIESMLDMELYLLAAENKVIRRCKLCNKLFVQKSLRSEDYCDRTYKDNGKTCKEQGPYLKSKNIQKTDPITKAHNTAYMRVYKAYKKGTYNKDAYDKWLEIAIDKREDARLGVISPESYFKWLSESKSVLMRLMAKK